MILRTRLLPVAFVALTEILASVIGAGVPDATHEKPQRVLVLYSDEPIYACYDTYLGHGIVGGTMVTFEEIGRKAAQLGMRILAGEDPQTAANSESHRPVPMFVEMLQTVPNSP